MSIGRFKSVCLNVTDMQRGLDFWSAVTGWDVRGVRHDWLGYLGPKGHEMILIHTDSAPIRTVDPERHEAGPMHIDIWANEGVDNAIEAIVSLGGVLTKPPSLYPRPGSYGGDVPLIDWAVMQDPFGNDFCVIEELTDEQGAAAVASGATDDHRWRVAAGVTPG